MSELSTQEFIDARAWLFPLGRKLSEEEVGGVVATLSDFVGSWSAHGAPLKAGIELLGSQIVSVYADESAVRASGCSIDKLIKEVEKVASSLGADLVRASHVIFWKDDESIAVPRETFQKLVKDGEIELSTPVFDNTVTSLSEVRTGKWKREFKDSWHARAFS